jgi:putative transposase
MHNLYKRHRFPPSVIQHAVWLYYRFNLSVRDVEDLLAERNISVSYEAIRLWINKFGPEFTKRLRRRHTGFGVTYFLDEVFSRLTANNTTFDAPSIRMVKSSMCIYKSEETLRQ